MAICAAAVWWGALGAANVDASEQATTWHSDYGEAYAEASAQHKLLLVFFSDPAARRRDACFQQEVLSHPCLKQRLARFVCVKLPTDAKIQSGGQTLRLLDHQGFAALRGKAGVAIVDLIDPTSPQYQEIVSLMPFTADRALTARQMAVLLDLEPGTFADRAAAYPAALRAAPRSGLQRFIDRTRTVLRTRRRGATEGRQGWFNDYQLARDTAERQGKMLLVYFHEAEANPERCSFENETLAHADVRSRLTKFVCARLRLDAQVNAEGQPKRVLEEPQFEEMLGQPGLAIVDFTHREASYYRSVVSTFPRMAGHEYTPERVATILDLPPGTLTQRTMVYAVRVHPERPASTTGQCDAYLAQEAEQHSQYQASIGRQGHHFWSTRFQRIGAQLGGLSPSEVCAESWPGQRLLESAIECVRCWRTSSGHWRGVSSPHPVYAYDIKRGSNGVWYATGIFGGG
jgi:hypothetical protein